jgi:hypothetical protein
MVNCNNDAYYFGRFGTLDHDVSETGSVFFIGIEEDNAHTHLLSLEATALEHRTIGEQFLFTCASFSFETI